ncbi:hypothetical protein Y032_0274g1026 [Ancylostoma ceylanicum]|uniref:Uncharacterized protein n=1 Tax=Ancylostoma ceylanicum TaxID=53326 RepID=A0A016S8X4_9BILA|nr:hypothetical protein Y032_0274g1026 [Ancylostoma ceylanicum]
MKTKAAVILNVEKSTSAAVDSNTGLYTYRIYTAAIDLEEYSTAIRRRWRLQSIVCCIDDCINFKPSNITTPQRDFLQNTASNTDCNCGHLSLSKRSYLLEELPDIEYENFTNTFRTELGSPSKLSPLYLK